MWKAKIVRLFIAAAAAGTGAFLFYNTEGVATLTCLGVLAVGAVLSLKFALELAACPFLEAPSFRFPSIIALMLTALCLPVLAFEVFLGLAAKGQEDRQDATGMLTMPEEWKKRP